MKKLLVILFTTFFVVSSLQALGVKACKDVEQVVDYDYFVLGYDEETECPLYVEYTLSSDEVKYLGTYERCNDFREDYSIKTGSATLNDYKSSGYTRGHLFPAYHGSFDREADRLSFLMSNMTPQTKAMNSGKWKELEKDVVTLAEKYGDVERICGPIFDSNKPKQFIGRNKVRVPERFFNIVSYKVNGKTVIECYIVTNGKNVSDVKVTKAKIETISKLTGIEFYK